MSLVGPTFGGGPVTGARARSEVKVAPGFQNTDWAKGFSFEVNTQTVNDKVLKRWVSSLATLRDDDSLVSKKGLSNGNFSFGALQPTTPQQVKDLYWSDLTTTLDEAGATQIVNFLKAKVAEGCTLQSSEWGDSSLEWLGQFVVAHKPGERTATLVNVVTNDNT